MLARVFQERAAATCGRAGVVASVCFALLARMGLLNILKMKKDDREREREREAPTHCKLLVTCCACMPALTLQSVYPAFTARHAF